MKKRIISALLCMLMLAGAAFSFVGCGDEAQKIYSETKPKAMTITITTVYDYDKTNENQVEALKQVQDALNLITEAKYNTHVVINAMSSEDYMETVLSMSGNVLNEIKGEEAAMNELLNAKSEAEKNEKRQAILNNRKFTSKYQVMQSEEWLNAANTDKVYLDENGRYKTIYPSVDKDGAYDATNGTQLDIVLINSSEMYNQMIFNNYLYYIDSTLSGDETTTNLISKYLNDFVHDYVDIDAGAAGEQSDLYAVPNNAVFGEYSYIVVNKELFDKYGYDINFDYSSIVPGSKGCDDFSDFENFVMDLVNDTSASDVRPVLNNPNLDFYSIFGDDSLLIADAVSKFSTDVTPSPKAITDSRIFKSYFRTMYTLTQKAATAPLTSEWLDGSELLEGGEYADTKFGVALVKGNVATLEELKANENYYVAVTNTPAISENVYESMYAISSCVAADPFNGAEARAARCYQILELFSTNKEWVNILTYGVEGEHYNISKQEPGLVVNRSEDYQFNRRYAGNMFLQYMSEDMTDEMKAYAENDWELGRLQNQKLSVSPYAGFTVAYEGIGISDVDLSEIREELISTVGKENFLVSDIVSEWEAYEAATGEGGSYKDLLSVNGENAFKDYENYKAATGGTIDDYLAYFKSVVIMQEFEAGAEYSKDPSNPNKGQYEFKLANGNKVAIPLESRAYAKVTGSYLNNPLSQYAEYFANKRDLEGSLNLFK